MTLSIVGERAAGKTHLALLAAIFDAHEGLAVLWQSHNMEYATHNMHNAEEILDRLGVKPERVTRANGNSGIHFAGGGHIHFRPPARSRPIGHYDTHILDDVHDVNTEPLATASHIIRTVCTGER